MFKDQRSILWIILVILALTIYHFANLKRSQLNRPEVQKRFDTQPPLPSSSPLPSVRPSSQPRTSPRASAADQGPKHWSQFKSKYGEDLIAQFTPDHLLSSIQGRIGQGAPQGVDFDFRDERQIKARAEAIIRELSVLIGERPDWPIEFSEIRLGPGSGQVYFQQTYQGLKVKPMGGVKVDLGPSGEIIGLYSDYAAQVQSVTPASLSESVVREKAREALTRQSLPGLSLSSIPPGQKIVWVSGGAGRVAYEFFVQGRNVVIDAQQGRTLLFRDRRHF